MNSPYWLKISARVTYILLKVALIAVFAGGTVPPFIYAGF